MKPLVYIAGPFTHPDPAKNTEKAVCIAAELWDSGVATPFVPHLALSWHIPRPIEDWYEYGLLLLSRCDAVLRIKGKSYGADKEVDEAKKLEIPIFYSVAETIEWIKNAY